MGEVARSISENNSSVYRYVCTYIRTYDTMLWKVGERISDLECFINLSTSKTSSSFKTRLVDKSRPRKSFPVFSVTRLMGARDREIANAKASKGREENLRVRTYMCVWRRGEEKGCAHVRRSRVARLTVHPEGGVGFPHA